MRIRIELASGRAVEGTVPKGDEVDVRSLLAVMTGYLHPRGWVRLQTDAGEYPTVVHLAQAETITELPE